MALPSINLNPITDEEDNNMFIKDSIINYNNIGDIAGNIEIFSNFNVYKNLNKNEQFLLKKLKINFVVSVKKTILK